MTENFNEALAQDLRRMGLMGEEPPVAENPTFIQSRADGTVYEFKFIESATGNYLYATQDGATTRILNAEDIAEGFHDVTDMEIKTRAEFAKHTRPCGHTLNDAYTCCLTGTVAIVSWDFMDHQCEPGCTC